MEQLLAETWPVSASKKENTWKITCWLLKLLRSGLGHFYSQSVGLSRSNGNEQGHIISEYCEHFTVC